MTLFFLFYFKQEKKSVQLFSQRFSPKETNTSSKTSHFNGLTVLILLESKLPFGALFPNYFQIIQFKMFILTGMLLCMQCNHASMTYSTLSLILVLLLFGCDEDDMSSFSLVIVVGLTCFRSVYICKFFLLDKKHFVDYGAISSLSHESVTHIC